MGWEKAVPAVLSVVSASGKSSAGKGAKQAGKAQQTAANYEAAQMRVNAGQVTAAAQRAAHEQRRQGALVQSRAIALAAAGGGSTTDPGIINLLANNAGEIAYRSAVELYDGEDKARMMIDQAKAREYSGVLAAKAGRDQEKAAKAGVFGDLLKGGLSLFSAFGGDLFDSGITTVGDTTYYGGAGPDSSWGYGD